jgi:hypothetical protein
LVVSVDPFLLKPHEAKIFLEKGGLTLDFLIFSVTYYLSQKTTKELFKLNRGWVQAAYIATKLGCESDGEGIIQFVTLSEIDELRVSVVADHIRRGKPLRDRDAQSASEKCILLQRPIEDYPRHSVTQ